MLTIDQHYQSRVKLLTGQLQKHIAKSPVTKTTDDKQNKQGENHRSTVKSFLQQYLRVNYAMLHNLNIKKYRCSNADTRAKIFQVLSYARTVMISDKKQLASACPNKLQHTKQFRATLYHTKLYHTLHYFTILCYTILYYTILYYTILYYTILYYTILYYTILYYAILYYTIQYYTILYYTILYYTIPYYTILYYAILYYTILYYIILYYAILCYTILYHTILCFMYDKNELNIYW